MARYDAYNSECLLFSFKDGLLARLAHDLKLQVERFSIEIDDTTHEIKATFDPSSIQVVCAQIDGRDDPSTLSKGDRKKIYDNVTKDVLRTRKHPEIRFDSTNVVERGEGFAVEGALQIHGKSRNIQTSVNHFSQRLRVIRGWSQRRDYLCSSLHARDYCTAGPQSLISCVAEIQRT